MTFYEWCKTQTAINNGYSCASKDDYVYYFDGYDYLMISEDGYISNAVLGKEEIKSEANYQIANLADDFSE